MVVTYIINHIATTLNTKQITVSPRRFTESTPRHRKNFFLFFYYKREWGASPTLLRNSVLVLHDLNVTSPYNIHTLSNKQVTRLLNVAEEGGCGRGGEMWQGRGDVAGKGRCGMGGGMWQERGDVAMEGGCARGGGMWQGRGDVKGRGDLERGGGCGRGGGMLTNNHCTQGQKFVITVF